MSNRNWRVHEPMRGYSHRFRHGRSVRDPAAEQRNYDLGFFQKTFWTENRPECTGRSFKTAAQKHDIKYILMEIGRPNQRVYIESLNDISRNELQRENSFKNTGKSVKPLTYEMSIDTRADQRVDIGENRQQHLPLWRTKMMAIQGKSVKPMLRSVALTKPIF